MTTHGRTRSTASQAKDRVPPENDAPDSATESRTGRRSRNGSHDRLSILTSAYPGLANAPYDLPGARPGIAATAYDTAWLAGIPAEDNPARSRYPAALNWLLDNQLPDGSWGGPVAYIHDRILCTLTALASLAVYGDQPEHQNSVDAGTRYLWQYGHLLSSEPTELVAFELLLPAMVKRARRSGVMVPPHLDIYAVERAEKMRLIPAGALYSPHVTIVHSLEFLDDQASLDGLRAAQGANGAIGNSPAATAFYYSLSRDTRALSYLEHCLRRLGGERAPVLYPCETYELLWAAYHLYLAGVPVTRLLRPDEISYLRQALANGGVSLAPSFPIPDADDTAVALLFLHELGDSPDPRVLRTFASPEGHFVSFPYERHSSVGVSLHAMHALLRVPGYPDAERAVEKLLEYLANQQISGLYWLDKWHISPYYVTSHALCVMAEIPPTLMPRAKPLIERSREWIRQTQNPDGSWGFFKRGTAEETAYALLALAASDPALITAQDRQNCARAAEYLYRHGRPANGNHNSESGYPPLWIDKCLYTPTLIVQATIDGALHAYERHIGGRQRRRN